MSLTSELGLCALCRPLPGIAFKLETVRNIPYHEDIDALRKSASGGCPLCAWMLRNLPDYGLSKFRFLEYLEESGSHHFSLRFLHANDLSQRAVEQIQQKSSSVDALDHLFMTFDLFDANDLVLGTKIQVPARKICEDPIDAISTIARPWITECQQKHAACRQPSRILLPTRVIQVEGYGADVALVDSNGLEGCYTILSYCWGFGTTLKTTPRTLAARKQRIAFEDLPLTLTDAVRVTRQLGVRYLWVDALCIIQEQDPPTDWLSESKKMLDYYRNALVTIGNLDGEASSSGFLSSRKQDFFEIPGGNGLSFRRTPLRLWWSIYFGSVLATRAWCLQERLVSSRLLLFGKDQMFWECRTSCEREGVVGAGREKLQFGMSIQGKRVEIIEHEILQVLASLGSDALDLRDCMNIWYSVVEQYTSRTLTRSTDMLVAISGVAEDFRRRTGYQYLSGLWKEDLCKGLVWSRRPGGQPTGAPSWSWASKTITVNFKVLQTGEDSRFNTKFEDQMEYMQASSNDQELYLRAKCRTLDSKDIFEGKIWKESNIYVFWDGPDGRDHVELDEKDENLYKGIYKAAYTLLRYSHAVELDENSELVLSGYFVASYLLLTPDATAPTKWRRIGLGTYRRDIVPTKICFEDLESEDIFQADRVRPKLLFDECDFEDICLI